MEYYDNLTISKNAYYQLEINERQNRAYLTLLGYWNNKWDLSEYISDIETGLQKMSKDFTLLVDLTHYDGTSPELQNLHIEAQKLAVKAGLIRIAEIFASNPIVKMFSETYSKESGANTMSFTNREHAERWLDLYL